MNTDKAPTVQMQIDAYERGRDDGAAAERQRIAAMVRRLRCCRAPQMCGAPCRDDETSWAIAKAANPIADLIESEQNQ